VTPRSPAAAGKGTAAPAVAGTTLPPMSEKAWQTRVLDYARFKGWRAIHHPDSRRVTEAGLPDLLLVRPPRVVFAELKSTSGVIRPAQIAMLAKLKLCPGVETCLWRPADWPAVMETLA